MSKSPNDTLTITIEERDTIDGLLSECLTVSELLWDSESTNHETSTRAGVMLAQKIKNIQDIVHQR